MSSKPLCIIPARGGSKRIPRKNVIDFNGKPMIAWPILAAIESKLYARIVVSTDDREIAEIAEGYGADVPFMRNSKLADDFTTTADVIIDALNRLPGYEVACCIYPTAPLIRPEHLQKAHSMLQEQNADCVLSVTEYDFHPLRAFEKGKDNSLNFKWPEHALTRSQDLDELVHDAGMFYVMKAQSLLRSRKIISGKTLGLKLPRNQAIDIDIYEDLEIARTLHREQNKAISG